MITENPEPLIAPCPFCGNEAQENFATLSDYIICSCGAAGPSALKVEDAVVRWNKRANPLPFREASEKPEGEVLVIGEDGESLEFGEWRESRQCMGVSPHNERGAGFVSERADNLPIHVQGWIDPKDFVAAFRAWKEGKAA